MKSDFYECVVPLMKFYVYNIPVNSRGTKPGVATSMINCEIGPGPTKTMITERARGVPSSIAFSPLGNILCTTSQPRGVPGTGPFKFRCRFLENTLRCTGHPVSSFQVCLPFQPTRVRLNTNHWLLASFLARTYSTCRLTSLLYLHKLMYPTRPDATPARGRPSVRCLPPSQAARAPSACLQPTDPALRRPGTPPPRPSFCIACGYDFFPTSKPP